MRSVTTALTSLSRTLQTLPSANTANSARRVNPSQNPWPRVLVKALLGTLR